MGARGLQQAGPQNESYGRATEHPENNNGDKNKWKMIWLA